MGYWNQQINKQRGHLTDIREYIISGVTGKGWR